MFYAWQYWQSMAVYYAFDLDPVVRRRQRLIPVQGGGRLYNLIWRRKPLIGLVPPD